MKGRPAKRTDDLKAAGTYRKDRHANRVAPALADAIPPAPAHFTGAQQQRWIGLCEDLKKDGLLANTDKEILRVYVETDSVCADAWAAMQEAGMYDGSRTSPQFRAWLEASKQLDRLQDKLGFSPRARMGLKVSPKEEKPSDPFAEILAMTKAKA